MPDEPLEPGPLPVSTALPPGLAKSSSESSSEESSSESSSEEEEEDEEEDEEEEESESSDSEEERAHRLAELQEQVFYYLVYKVISCLCPNFFSLLLLFILLLFYFYFSLYTSDCFVSSSGQYMNNWLPCLKAQYPSQSGREREKRKRRNGRQRSIEAELGLMKMTRDLGHPAHLNPRSPRKQVVVGVAVLLHWALPALDLLEEAAASKFLRGQGAGTKDGHYTVQGESGFSHFMQSVL